MTTAAENVSIPDVLHNPVFEAYFADPFCFFHDGVFYAVGTGRDEADACPVTGNVVPMVKSVDLQHWRRVGHVLKQTEEERAGCFWAPEVATDGRRFYMYYHPNGKRGLKFHIRCAVADSPEGPYVDTGRPMTDLAKNPFAIDAHAFRDEDGQWYMYYATDFLDVSDKVFRGTALVVDRMKSMTDLEGNPRTVARATHDWQVFKRGRDMYGTVADWYTMEGPTVLKRGGKYWMFYSGGCYEDDTYGVDVLVADHPLGPWREPFPERSARGPQVVRTIPGRILGPGHNSVVTTPGGVDYFVYHAWDKGFRERQLWVDRLEWTEEGPRIGRFAEWIREQNRVHS
ncbi:MAG: glycoside hydrolase family 43 protein [Phycisphaerae bacterium]